MCGCTRRSAVMGAAAALLATRRAAAEPASHRDFVAAAFRMKAEAVAAGDQPYGAVVVKDGKIIGYGPSRVVSKNDATAHAEREAIRAAQAALGSSNLSGCLLYSTSRPCAACERAAAEAQIARMLHGDEPIDAGPPR